MKAKTRRRKRVGGWALLTINGRSIFFTKKGAPLAQIPLGLGLALRDQRGVDVDVKDDIDAGVVRFIQARHEVAAIPKDLAAVLADILDDWDGNV